MNIQDSIKSITAGQINKIHQFLGAALHKTDLQSEPSQHALEHQGNHVSDAMADMDTKNVEAASGMIVYHVAVNRSLSLEEICDTGRKKRLDGEAVASMPQGDSDEVDVFFFNLGCNISESDLDKEYELRGLKPDPRAQFAVNKTDPAFSDNHPNGTHWRDEGGNWCYAAWDRWSGLGRTVRVLHDSCGWRGSWWFGGVRTS